ncbi:FAD/NAD(P)-binding protein, partial [Sulfitobacter sp. HI0129]
MFEVVIVGSGPTSLYTIAALLDRPAGLSITVLEREEMSGTGMPFRPEETDSVLLANIASIEVPPICESLLDWITGLPDAVLSHLGISEDDLHERHFFPRILLGAYLRSQLGRLADLAEERGHR